MNLKRITLLLLSAVLISWGIGSLLLLRDEREAAKDPAPIALESGVATSSPRVSREERHSAAIPEAPIAKETVQVATTATVVSPTVLPRATISVTLALAGKSHAHRLLEGASVEALMNLARDAGEIAYTAKTYAGLGALVTAIDGKTNDADHNDMYWILSVNGKKATTGISTYVLHDGDVVTWTYEKNEYN